MVGGYWYCAGTCYLLPRRWKQSGTLVQTYQTTWCNKPEGHNIKARVYTSSDITSNVGGNIWGQQQTLN